MSGFENGRGNNISSHEKSNRKVFNSVAAVGIGTFLYLTNGAMPTQAANAPTPPKEQTGQILLNTDGELEARRRVIINNPPNNHPHQRIQKRNNNENIFAPRKNPPQLRQHRNNNPIRIEGHININLNLGNQQVIEPVQTRNLDTNFFRSQVTLEQVQQCQNIVTSQERSDIRNLEPERNQTNFVNIANRYFSTDPRVCDAGDRGFLTLALEVGSLSQNRKLMNDLSPSNQRYLNNLSNIARIVSTIERKKIELASTLNDASFRQDLINIQSEFELQENAIRANNRANSVLRDTSLGSRSTVNTFNTLMKINAQYENRQDNARLTQLIRGNRNFLNTYQRVYQISQDIYSLQNQGLEIINSL